MNGDFLRREAAEAVRTFFKPVLGTYHLVVEASNPPMSRRSEEGLPNAGRKNSPR
ncbi:MAG TPA: hypothetical protein VFE13_15255 [Caulobacteraceae bacterium]|nr:hypothetical protein [Caulobacteraceae bacterium]